jgi:two-component system KDP operon response regulator KdpE
MSTAEVRKNILVIDDEAQIRRLLRLTLEGSGYTVRETATGKEGLDEIVRRAPDAVVLDMGLPDMSGLDVLRQLREWSRVPVLVLTVLAAETDKVAALDAGADDYLTKPFGAAELNARLRAILRRAPSENEPAIVAFGEVTVDFASRIVRRAGVEVKLTHTHYLRVHMNHLRQKLETDLRRPQHLKTESGIGYRLIEE